MNRLGWYAMGIGSLILFLAIILVRSHRPAAKSPPGSKLARSEIRSSHYVAPRNPGLPAAPAKIENAASDIQVRSTFLNFRTAVATGNVRLQNSLRRVLERDRSRALEIAQECLNENEDQVSREISLKALEALKP